MRVLIATGALKHSVTADAAAELVAAGLTASGLACDCTLLPMADGGNGTVEAFCVQAGSSRRTVTVRGPLGDAVEATYGLLNDGSTAVIEMAQASGIELIPDAQRNALAACSYGTGQLIADAVAQGARHLVVGLGGSATTDGGAGCLQALGATFYNRSGEQVMARGGGSLHHIARVDLSAVHAQLAHCDMVIACDVDNPAIGPAGAAPIYGPQKGADADHVRLLDSALDHWFQCLRDTAGTPDVRNVSGAGAAGALAGGLLAIGGKIEPGFAVWNKLSHFSKDLQAADLVITSEGQIDEQTVFGKGPAGVAQAAQAAGKPCVVLVGSAAASPGYLAEYGMPLVMPIGDGPQDLAQAIQRGPELLQAAAQRLGYMIRYLPHVMTQD